MHIEKCIPFWLWSFFMLEAQFLPFFSILNEYRIFTRMNYHLYESIEIFFLHSCIVQRNLSNAFSVPKNVIHFGKRKRLNLATSFVRKIAAKSGKKRENVGAKKKEKDKCFPFNQSSCAFRVRRQIDRCIFNCEKLETLFVSHPLLVEECKSSSSREVDFFLGTVSLTNNLIRWKIDETRLKPNSVQTFIISYD